jgi:uncharacterized glyoxalase superfamily protein PhnB
MAVDPIPEQYGSVTPYLVVEGAAGLLEFISAVFEGEEQGGRMQGPEGKIQHAEIKIGNSIVMAMDAREPGQAMPGMLNVYVKDCDAVFARALEAGATEVQPLTDQFYGDRSGGVRDPWGNVWWISTHVEDVDPEEMQRRVEAFVAGQQSQSQS